MRPSRIVLIQMNPSWLIWKKDGSDKAFKTVVTIIFNLYQHDPTQTCMRVCLIQWEGYKVCMNVTLLRLIYIHNFSCLSSKIPTWQLCEIPRWNWCCQHLL